MFAHRSVNLLPAVTELQYWRLFAPAVDLMRRSNAQFGGTEHRHNAFLPTLKMGKSHPEDRPC
jgi:hypothetical protein